MTPVETIAINPRTQTNQTTPVEATAISPRIKTIQIAATTVTTKTEMVTADPTVKISADDKATSRSAPVSHLQLTICESICTVTLY